MRILVFGKRTPEDLDAGQNRQTREGEFETERKRALARQNTAKTQHHGFKLQIERGETAIEITLGLQYGAKGNRKSDKQQAGQRGADLRHDAEEALPGENVVCGHALILARRHADRAVETHALAVE